MEGLQFIIFLLVAVGWLAIWIIKMFRNAFNQPAATNRKPYVPKPNTSVEEMLRQHRPKPEAEILERSVTRPAHTLEVPEGRRQSLETLVPMGTSQERVLGESVAQREDIVRRRREKSVNQQLGQQPVSVFAQMLRNPESARNAVVLAEILKRKF